MCWWVKRWNIFVSNESFHRQINKVKILAAVSMSWLRYRFFSGFSLQEPSVPRKIYFRISSWNFVHMKSLIKLAWKISLRICGQSFFETSISQYLGTFWCMVDICEIHISKIDCPQILRLIFQASFIGPFMCTHFQLEIDILAKTC